MCSYFDQCICVWVCACVRACACVCVTNSLVFGLAVKLKTTLSYRRCGRWSMFESDENQTCESMCVFVCTFLCERNAFPRTRVRFRSDDLDSWYAKVWMCALPVCAVVFVGMQQANHSIVGHVSSMIANRLPPQFSAWKINAMLFLSVYFPDMSLSHTHLELLCFFSPDTSDFSHLKITIILGFCNSCHWLNASLDAHEYDSNHCIHLGTINNLFVKKKSRISVKYNFFLK